MGGGEALLQNSYFTGNSPETCLSHRAPKEPALLDSGSSDPGSEGKEASPSLPKPLNNWTKKPSRLKSISLYYIHTLGFKVWMATAAAAPRACSSRVSWCLCTCPASGVLGRSCRGGSDVRLRPSAARCPGVKAVHRAVFTEGLADARGGRRGRSPCHIRCHGQGPPCPARPGRWGWTGSSCSHPGEGEGAELQPMTSPASVGVGGHGDEQDVEALVARRGGAHGESVEAGAGGARARGVPCGWRGRRPRRRRPGAPRRGGRARPGAAAAAGTAAWRGRRRCSPASSGGSTSCGPHRQTDGPGLPSSVAQLDSPLTPVALPAPTRVPDAFPTRATVSPF
jgi:hypothetical protein